MAELLVQVIDKTHEDPFANQTHCKRGDVVVACPDGWSWGREEVKDPRTLILKVPGLSLQEAEAMTTPEIGDRRVTPMLHERAFYLETLPEVVGVPRVAVISIEQFRAAKKRKAAAENPFAIGA